jgi:transposase
MSIRGAAAAINVPKSTAYNWYKKGRESMENDEDIVMGTAKDANAVGRPEILNDNHKDYLVSLADEQPSIVLDEMMEGLVGQFGLHSHCYRNFTVFKNV